MSSGEEEKFKVTVNIKRDDCNALVFYKQDGQRFDHDCTIKMKVQTPYRFLLTFRPPQKITSAFLKGEELEFREEEVTQQVSKYCLLWVSNNIPVTKKNSRFSFPLILDVHNLGTLELTLQLKFYPQNETGHSAWGKSLHQIDFTCVYKPGKSFVEVTQHVFR